MLRATLSTTIRAVRTKSTGTEPRCIAIPRNCPDGDATLIRRLPRRGCWPSRCKLSDAEGAHAHDGRRRHDHGGRRSDHHGSRINHYRRRLCIGAGRRYIIERWSISDGRTLQHFDRGDEGRRAVHRPVIEVPGATHVPPPAVTAVAPFVAPATAFPRERPAIVAASEGAPGEIRMTREVNRAPGVTRPTRVTGRRTHRVTGRCTPGVSRAAGVDWTGWTYAGRRAARRGVDRGRGPDGRRGLRCRRPSGRSLRRDTAYAGLCRGRQRQRRQI